MMFAQEVVWATSLALTKISILALYCKVFTLRTFIVVAQVTVCIIVLWYFASDPVHLSDLKQISWLTLCSIQDVGSHYGMFLDLPANRGLLGSDYFG
jgi:hypothetical protein